MRRQGLEPCLLRLRVECFTCIARGAREPHRGIEPRSPVWRTGVIAVRPVGHGGSSLNRTGIFRASTGCSAVELKSHLVGKQGIEPRLPGPRPGALTITRHPGALLNAGGGGRNRTDSSTLARRDRCLSCHPQRAAAPRNTQERPRYVGRLPGRGGIPAAQTGLPGRRARAARRFGAHAMEFSTVKPVRRGSQGRQDSNPHNAALETAVLPLNYVPKQEEGKEKPPVRCP